MFIQQLPIEILRLMFMYLNKSDIRTCSAVNKTWHQFASSLLDQEIKLSLKASQFQKASRDLAFCNSLAAKVTCIDFFPRKFHKENIQIIKSIIQHCFNVCSITFGPFDNLDVLKMLYLSNLNLPRIQEFIFRYLPTVECRKYELMINLKYKNTINSLSIEMDQELSSIPGFDNLISFTSQFPKLKNLTIRKSLATHKQYTIDLNKLLFSNKNLQNLRLKCIDVTKRYKLNDFKRRTYPNLKVLTIVCCQLDMSVLQYIIPRLVNKLQYLGLITMRHVIPDRSLTASQVDGVFKHIVQQFQHQKSTICLFCIYNGRKYDSSDI